VTSIEPAARRLPHSEVRCGAVLPDGPPGPDMVNPTAAMSGPGICCGFRLENAERAPTWALMPPDNPAAPDKPTPPMWATLRRFMIYLWPKDAPALRRRAVRQSAQRRVRARRAGGDPRSWRSMCSYICIASRCASTWQSATGEVTKVIERGTKSIDTMLYFLLFNIAPTGDRADRGLRSSTSIWLGAGCGDRRDGRGLYLPSPAGSPNGAMQLRERDEPARWTGAGPCGRFAAELRDGEILQRRRSARKRRYEAPQDRAYADAAVKARTAWACSTSRRR
jgi:hypothetical protein